MEFVSRSPLAALLIAAGLVTLLAAPAGAGSLSDTKVALHVTTPPAKSSTVCTTYRPDVPCSDYILRGDVSAGYYVYLATGQTDPSAGILALSCGIDYDPAPGQGVDVIQWIFCSDGVEYPNDGPNGPWPASGGGNRMTWSTCQNTEIPPDGAHAVWGAFYIYAYGDDQMRVTPNENIVNGPEFKVVDCSLSPAEELDPAVAAGWASFSSGAASPGFNPCLGPPSDCGVSPGLLSFGNVLVGGSKDLSFTLSCPATAATDLTGTLQASCPDFQVVGDASYDLAPGESAMFTVRFAPGGSGIFQCRLDAGGTCPFVDLFGIGGGNCSVHDDLLLYGAVPLGQFADRSFTITNTAPGGGSNLMGSVVLDCPGDFQFVSGGGDYTLAPGQSRTVTVRFTPSAVGLVTCEVETGSACGGVSLRASGGVPSGEMPVVALHAQAPPSKAPLTCTSAPSIPCSQYTTRAETGTGRFVYLVVAQADPLLGVAGLSCGIDYDALQGEGVDVISWTLCSDGLEFRNSGANGTWPAAGGGNQITWVTCQHDEIAPDGVHAVAGAFYVYAYGEDDLSVTPNNNLLRGAELAVSNCFLAVDYLPFEDVGRVAFSPEMVRTGTNPCLEQIQAAAVSIDPQTLNAAAGGKWMTGYVELPPGYDPGDVDPETVRLQSAIPADPAFFQDRLGDFNGNGVPDLKFKFDRAAFVDRLPADGDEVEAVVTGEVGGTAAFTAAAPVQIVRPHMVHPNGGESLIAGSLQKLVWDVPPGWSGAIASLFYSTDHGASWTRIADTAESGGYIWRLPTEPLEAVSLRVEVHDDFGVLGRDETDGTFAVTQATGIGDLPVRNALLPNAPNPFSASTRIRYELAEANPVTLTVYNVQGQRVRVLVEGTVPAGPHEARWDGRDAAGKPAASGVYLLDLRAGTYRQTRRMLLAR